MATRKLYDSSLLSYHDSKAPGTSAFNERMELFLFWYCIRTGVEGDNKKPLDRLTTAI